MPRCGMTYVKPSWPDDINLTLDDIEVGLSRLKLKRAAAGDGCLPEALRLIQVGVLRQLTKGQAPESFLGYHFGGAR